MAISDEEYEAYAETEDFEIEKSLYLKTHQPLSTSELASSRITLPPFLFQDFLLNHSLTMISGEPYSGKTFLLLAMAISLDFGTPLFGRYAPNSGQRCLFIGKDSPAWDYQTQIKKLCSPLPPELIQSKEGSLFFFRKSWQLSDSGFIDFILNTIKLFDITVVMFDTLLRFHSLDENSNKDMSLVLSLLERIRNEGHCAVIFTHHTSKPLQDTFRSTNYQARGASVIPGTVDQHIHLRPWNDRIMLSAPKMRGTDGQPIKFSYRLLSRNNGIVLELNETDDLSSRILDKLKELPCNHPFLVSCLQPLYPGVSNLTQRITGELSALSRQKKIKKLESGLWTLAS